MQKNYIQTELLQQYKTTTKRFKMTTKSVGVMLLCRRGSAAFTFLPSGAMRS